MDFFILSVIIGIALVFLSVIITIGICLLFNLNIVLGYACTFLFLTIIAIFRIYLDLKE